MRRIPVARFDSGDVAARVISPEYTNSRGQCRDFRVFKKPATLPHETRLVVRRNLLELRRHPPPARRRQSGGLLEAAGEMALMREAAVGRNLRQVLVAG